MKMIILMLFLSCSGIFLPQGLVASLGVGSDQFRHGFLPVSRSARLWQIHDTCMDTQRVAEGYGLVVERVEVVPPFVSHIGMKVHDTKGNKKVIECDDIVNFDAVSKNAFGGVVLGYDYERQKAAVWDEAREQGAEHFSRTIKGCWSFDVPVCIQEGALVVWGRESFVQQQLHADLSYKAGGRCVNAGFAFHLGVQELSGNAQFVDCWLPGFLESNNRELCKILEEHGAEKGTLQVDSGFFDVVTEQAIPEKKAPPKPEGWPLKIPREEVGEPEGFTPSPCVIL